MRLFLWFQAQLRRARLTGWSFYKLIYVPLRAEGLRIPLASPLGSKTCRRAQVESLRAEQLGAAASPKDKLIKDGALPQSPQKRPHDRPKGIDRFHAGN
jgi:hypothetical protein